MRNYATIAAASTLLTTTITRILTKGQFAGDRAYEAFLRLPTHVSEQTLFIITTSLALITLILYAIYTKQEQIPYESIVLLAVSPAFITAAVTEPYALVIGFLAVVLALIQKHPLAIPLIAAMCYLHPVVGLLALVYLTKQIKEQHQIRAIIATVLCASMMYLSNATIRPEFQIAELQALGATSILLILLALTGAILAWSHNTYQWAIALLVVSFAGLFLPELRLVASLAAATLAGKALRILQKRTWQLEIIKNTTTYFIILALVFSSASAASVTVNAEPGSDIQQVLELTTYLVDEEEKVFIISDYQHVFRYNGIQVTTENEEIITELRNADTLENYITPRFILQANKDVPNLRFVIENSREYIPLYQASHELWGRTT